MKRNTILAIATIVILLLTAGGFLLSKKASYKTSLPTQSATTNQETQAESKSLKDLFTSGVSQTCTFSVGSESTGNVYVANGKMRGDFTVNAADKVITSHMISDGKTSYVWMDGEKTGFKMAFDVSNASPVPEASASTTVDLNKKFDYNCTPSVSDASKFSLPTDVTFTDMSELKAPKIPAGGMDAKAAQCAACNQAPSGYQAQCKAALGCE